MPLEEALSLHSRRRARHAAALRLGADQRPSASSGTTARAARVSGRVVAYDRNYVTNGEHGIEVLRIPVEKPRPRRPALHEHAASRETAE